MVVDLAGVIEPKGGIIAVIIFPLPICFICHRQNASPVLKRLRRVEMMGFSWIQMQAVYADHQRRIGALRETEEERLLRIANEDATRIRLFPGLGAWLREIWGRQRVHNLSEDTSVKKDDPYRPRQAW